MKQLGLVLLQLDEACRYLKDGRLSQLRLALLLLDNAAEIQMEKCIEDQLMYEDMRERVRYEALKIPEDARTIDLQELVEWQPLSRKQKRTVLRYFDEKVRFLSDRVERLDVRLADPLMYLHRYRNEAYHHAKVRQATIETAAKLLLDINCELLLSLSPGAISHDPSEDYSWLEEKFGKKSVSWMNYKGIVEEAADKFRADINLSDKDVGKLLAEHFESRIEDVLSALDFIVENTHCPDHENAIKDSYQFGLAQQDPARSKKDISEEAERRHSILFLDGLRQKLSKISCSPNRFEAFNQFADLELRFEPVEDNVQRLAAEIDHAIEMAVDIARGK